jgi:CheY-like chemotaxis protein
MNMHVDKDVNVVMATDITIRQILMNLVKNSIQAMPLEEGIIDINVSNDIILIERFGLSKGNYVKIEVEDNGNGMSPEILERAIDPYFTTKKEGIGSGIGLSVVSSIVQGYNGFVRLYSEEGKGTKVVIYLPSVVEEKDMRFDECRLDDISNGNGEKILLVDDEKIVIDVVVSVLKSLNYKVEFFLNSSEAFKEFVKRPDDFDVVITDLTMPEMTGVTLINEIRGLRPEQKIILCSGLGSNGNIKEKIPGKVVAYLTKPVSRSDYAKVLSRILNEDI